MPPVSCPDGGKPRYRSKKTSKGTVRLAFCGNRAVEAKNLKTGEVHTSKEFARDKVRKKGSLGR